MALGAHSGNGDGLESLEFDFFFVDSRRTRLLCNLLLICWSKDDTVLVGRTTLGGDGGAPASNKQI
jgi:hypothetical protein